MEGTDRLHDDVIKRKHFSRYWPFVRGIHRSPVNSPHKGQWRGALKFFFLICAWINGWVNNGEAGDLRRHRAHYDVTVMNKSICAYICHFKHQQAKYFYHYYRGRVKHICISKLNHHWFRWDCRLSGWKILSERMIDLLLIAPLVTFSVQFELKRQIQFMHIELNDLEFGV